ncbi:hypothetical protein Tco_0004654 [Tanacetum coccineum]
MLLFVYLILGLLQMVPEPRNPSSLYDIHARNHAALEILRRNSVWKIVQRACVAKAIEKYEKTRADKPITGGSGSTILEGLLCQRCKSPRSNVKAMMTTDTVPATEINKDGAMMLWTLTMKGDDIEAYSNRFHELF